MAATAMVAVAGKASAQMAPTPGGAIGRGARSLRINPDNVRMNNYLHDLVGPGALIGMVGGSVVDQLRGQRSGSDDLTGKIAQRATQNAVQASVYHGLAALMHRSTEYQPCECHGFGPKVGHALLETFTDRRDDGSRALALPRFASAYAGGMAGLAFEHDKNPGDVALSTTLSFGLTALFNVGKELSGIGH
ncbi:MAG TPA: hypothetical protein VFX42_11555 [Gemmatimonadales bacterium]|nr:hypothetical protein [Gemmatimonadales bacterium]